MIEAILTLKTQQKWVVDLVNEHGAMVKILGCKAGEGSCGTEELVEITAPDEDLDDIIKKLHQNSLICESDISKVARGRAFGLVKTSSCIACRLFTESKCFVTSARTKVDGAIEYTLTVPSFRHFTTLLRKMEDNHIDVHVDKIVRVKSRNILTSRQQQIIRSAFEAGYFNYPRKIDLADLAESQNISMPTLIEILRRAQRRLVAEYLRGED